MHMHRIAATGLVVFAFGCATDSSEPSARSTTAEARADDAPEATAFPRTLALASGAFTAYEPQIEDHAGFTEATAWSAAAYRPTGGPPTFGTVKYRAKLVTDLDTRLVTIYDREILEVQFSELDDADMARLAAELRATIQSEPETMPLDVMLGYVADTATDSVSVAVSYDPPTIIYASTPTMLVVLDGEPITTPVDGAAGLSIVVNTNWDLFYAETTQTYSLLLGDAWLSAPSLDGPWTAATAPEGVSALPDIDRWTRVKDAAPGGSLRPADTPDIVVAPAPAELIVTNGPPELEPIPGTQLSFVANTSSDIVFNGDDQLFYFLISGRWFKAASLDGEWRSVKTAPRAFQEIPAGHPRSHIRASVAGTPEATRAVAQAQVPQTAEVSRETQAPRVQYAGEPQFEKIKGADVLRATNTTFDVFWVDDFYYLCHEAVWFVSETPNGPWRVTDDIPAAIYAIPADSPAHHVTYAKVYESTPDTVYVGYTSGYNYNYVSSGVVVYGSGYYWGSYYNPYYYSYYPSYYYYPYPYTYGQASIYETTTGAYVHGHYAYGPYGGYWEGSRYSPRTGRYGEGAYAWDYDTGVYEGWAYNPRTDVRVDTSQTVQWSDSNSYESWGETVVQRDENWVQAERYGDEDGFRRDVESSAGGQGTQIVTQDNRVAAGQTADGDLYAGANGSVYRRTEDGQWETRSDGEWTSVDSAAARDGAKTQAREMGLDPTTFDQRPQDTQFGDLDLQQLERDLSARTSGRSRYESFQSEFSQSWSGSRSGSRSGGRWGSRSRGGRRR